VTGVQTCALPICSGSSFGSLKDIKSTGPYSEQLTYSVDQITACSKDTVGYDQFSYYAYDSNGTASNEAQVFIHLHDFPIIKNCFKTPIGSFVKNNPPIAYGTDNNPFLYPVNSTDRTIHVEQNKSLSFDLRADNQDELFIRYDDGSVQSAGTIDSENLTYTILSYPKHGDLTDFIPPTKVAAPSKPIGAFDEFQYPLGVKYTPQPGYIGEDSFVFRVNDSQYVSLHNATISLTVSPPPPPPPSAAKVGIIGGSTICSETAASKNSCQGTEANYIMNGGVLLSPNKQKYEFVGIPLPLSSTATGRNLSQFSTVILSVASQPKVNGFQGLGCDTNSLNSTEKNALVSFMRNGGKLIIYD